MHNTTSKTKKGWIGLAIVNICLILLCTGAFAANAFVLRADAANYSTEELTVEEWYDVNPDGSELSVHLNNRFDGYAWKYGMSNDNVKEVYSFELEDGQFSQEVDNEWNVHFVPNSTKDGDVIITFVYIADSDSKAVETRQIKVHIRNGKMTVA